MEPVGQQRISERIIGAAYIVHNKLGYGFVEKVYKNALAVELGEAQMPCDCEVPLRVMYRGRVVGEYYADMVVAGEVIVEIKAVSKLDPIHEVQLVNYLKASGLHLGLLINFGRSVDVRRRVFGSPSRPGQP